MLSTATVTFDAAQILGADFDARRTKVRVYTNVANKTLIDTAANLIRMGDQTVAIASDGAGSFTTWAPGADGNPISWQTYVAFDYPRTGARDRQTRVFGPYTITADANLADLEAEQAVPAEYLTAVTAELQAMIDQGLKGPTGDTGPQGAPGGSDAATAGWVSTGPLTGAALSASFASLKVWARSPDQMFSGAVTRDSNGAPTSAAVIWPDGATGTYTTDTASTTFPPAVDAFHVTRVVTGQPTKTYTQPAVTRDADGNVTNLPDLTAA